MAEEKGKSYSHIIKYTGLFGSIQMLNILVGLVRNKLVAMILGPGGMGLASLFNSTIKLFSDTVSLGVPMSGVREVAATYESGNRESLDRSIAAVRLLSFCMAFVGALLCFALARLLDTWTFSWGNHSLHFALLAPAVALTVVAAGEMAIVKGTKQLRILARISVYQVFLVLFMSVPLYYFWGESAIVPVITLVALSQMVLTMWASYRHYPLSDSFHMVISGGVCRISAADGTGDRSALPLKRLVVLGGAFVLSGGMASGADFLIRAYINNVSTLDDVGFFNSGFVLVSLYAGMVFASMESDYYPRLSSIPVESREFRDAVNRQVEATVLLVAPVLIAFMLFMPVVMPLLYTRAFIPVVSMAQVSLLAMFGRAVYLPIEYMSLASARSRVFLLQETVSAVLYAASVIVGYSQWGLWGAGVGIVAAYMLELLFVLGCSYRLFGYLMSRDALKYLVVQFAIALLAYAAVSHDSPIVYWFGGAACLLLSLSCSLTVMRRA